MTLTVRLILRLDPLFTPAYSNRMMYMTMFVVQRVRCRSCTNVYKFLRSGITIGRRGYYSNQCAHTSLKSRKGGSHGVSNAYAAHLPMARIS